jgi:uncharacterized protein YegP (UPF0339 family)
MFEIKRSVDGKFFWTFQGDNNETLCTSEIYESKAGAENGVEAVKREASDARVVDRT